jgi:hypothetical protein
MKKLLILSFLTAVVTASLGQIPGINAEPAFEVLAQYQKVRDLTITSDGKEAYFTLQSPLEEVSVIAVIRKKEDSWTEPDIVHFTGRYRDLEPFLSPDGLRLYFVSNRPLEASQNEPKDFDIWYVERSALGEEWGEPFNIGAPVNTEHNEFYPAITNSGNLYITSDRPDSQGQDDIFFCPWLGEGFDESFLIFSGYNREDGYGSGDMYISVRGENKVWSQAINLGEDINSKYMDYCPYVDLNTMTLYFTSRRSSIENINRIQSLDDFNGTVNIYENGNSRLYKITINNNLLPEGK